MHTDRVTKRDDARSWCRLLSPRIGEVLARDVGKTLLSDLQFEEDIGVRAERRGEAHRIRHAVEPFAAGTFGRAGFAAMKCGCVAQAELRQHTAARFDTKAFHHFTNICRLSLAYNSHDGVSPVHLEPFWIEITHNLRD